MNAVIKILHLEDLRSDALLIEREVKKGQFLFELQVVDTKKEYLDALDNFKPDIILSDHSLPSFDSAEALCLVQEKKLDIPFILVTGNVSEEFAVTIIKSGAWDYILKDRMQRLPNAIISAVEKFQLKKLQQKYIDDIIANELLFKQAEGIAQFGLWKVDAATRHFTWSEQTYSLMGYEPYNTPATYKNFLRNIIPEDIYKVNQTIRKAFRESNNATIEFGVTMPDKSTRYLRTKFIVERNNAHKVISITGFNQDITEAKLAEEFIYRSQANLQTIFDHTDTAFILMDAQFKIQSYNLKAEIFILEQFNKTLSVGSYALDYVPENRLAKFKSIMNKALNSEKLKFETNYTRENEDVQWFDIRWMPISNPMRKKLGLILSITDVTERKLEEIDKEKRTAMLLQRNEELQQFNFIVSHNLRAPLTNIMGLTAVLKDLNDEQVLSNWKHIVPMIDECSMKLDQVIMDLNTILNLRSNLKNGAEEVDLYVLMDDIKSLLPLNNKEDIDIQYDFDEVPIIRCIKSYLHSIFLNLISNSLKFKSPDRKLFINMKILGRKNNIEIIFKDNGRGINIQNRKAEVFKLYSRLHEEIEGRGMGLFMIKTQVELMKGKIAVQSEPDKGVTFTIVLPQ